ncbi:hypothetical protein RI054_02g11020 [Pseudoscourfieldia marina]
MEEETAVSDAHAHEPLDVSWVRVTTTMPEESDNQEEGRDLQEEDSLPETRQLGTGVWAHASAALQDTSELFVYGGYNAVAQNARRETPNALILDLCTLKWRRVPPPPPEGRDGKPAARAFHSAVVAPGGRVVVFGGRDGAGRRTDAVLCFDRNTSMWTSPKCGGRTPPPPMEAHGAAMVGATTMAVVGGWLGADLGWSRQVYFLDVETWTWSRDAMHAANRTPRSNVELTPQRSEHALVPGAAPWCLHVVGGIGENGPSTDVWSLDTVAMSWRCNNDDDSQASPSPSPSPPLSSSRSLPFALAGHAAACKPGIAWIFGGCEGAAWGQHADRIYGDTLMCVAAEESHTTRLERLPVRTLTEAPQPRAHHTITYAPGADALLLYGGCDGADVFPGLWVAHVPTVRAAGTAFSPSSPSLSNVPRLHRSLLHGEALAARDAADAAFRAKAAGVLETLLERVANARSDALTAKAFYERTVPWMEEERARLEEELARMADEVSACASREAQLRADIDAVVTAQAAGPPQPPPVLELPPEIEEEMMRLEAGGGGPS